MAITCALTANIARDRKKKPDPYTPQDFLPKVKGSEKENWEQMLKTVESLTLAFGGKDNRGK